MTSSLATENSVPQEYMIKGHSSAAPSKNKAIGSSRTAALVAKKISNKSTMDAYTSSGRGLSKDGNVSVSSGKSAGYNTVGKAVKTPSANIKIGENLTSAQVNTTPRPVTTKNSMKVSVVKASDKNIPRL